MASASLRSPARLSGLHVGDEAGARLDLDADQLRGLVLDDFTARIRDDFDPFARTLDLGFRLARGH